MVNCTKEISNNIFDMALSEGIKDVNETTEDCRERKSFYRKENKCLQLL